MTIINDFINLFFPTYCHGCGQSLVKGEEAICSACDYALPKTNFHLEQNNPVRLKFSGKVPVQYAMAFLRFSRYGLTQKLMHKLKYDGKPEIAEILGKKYASDIQTVKAGIAWDVIVAVPLHKSKKSRRGYNQSDYWAQGLADGLGIPFESKALRKKTNNSSQTSKSRLDRWENVKDAFEVVQQEVIVGKRVLLVDDVITSGATLEACGMKLLQAQCSSLSVATIATA